MQIRQLEYFTEVVECGSLNRASLRLFISTQMLSASIASMEQELGTKLFRRSSKGVELTEAGRSFLKDAKQILEITGTWSRFREQKKGLSGEAHIYTSYVLCKSLSGFVTALHKENPELTIAIHERRGMSVVDELGRGRGAVGVASIIPEEEEDFFAELRRIGAEATLMLEDSLCVVVNAENPEFAAKDSLTKEDCKNMRLLLSSDVNDPIGKRFFSYFRTDYPIRLDNHSSLMNLVLENRGVLLLPRRMMEQETLYRRGVIRLLPLSDVELPQGHFMIRKKKLPQRSLEYKLSEMITAYYTSGAWQK